MCVPAGKTWQGLMQRFYILCMFAVYLLGLCAYHNAFPPFIVPEASDYDYKVYMSDTAVDDIAATQHYVASLARANMTLGSPIHLHAALDQNAAVFGAHVLGIADALSFASPMQQHIFEHTNALPPSWGPILHDPLAMLETPLPLPLLEPQAPITLHLHGRLPGGTPKKKYESRPSRRRSTG